MSRALRIQNELAQIHTVEDLTEVFESIASIHISKIRNRVVASKDFFAELWQTYSQLRVDPDERLQRTDRTKKDQTVFVAVTSEGKLSGEVDEHIADEVIRNMSETTDVVVIGMHGIPQLRQRGVRVTQAFPLPPGDTDITIGEILQVLSPYGRIEVFYQTYESLRVQKIARIELLTAVKALGQDVESSDEVVSSRDYIFEPGINEIANYMEGVMMGVALIQIIMDSKLAGYAARFNAMSAAKKRAEHLSQEFRQNYYRAKRAESDERQKEIIKAVRFHAKGATL